MTDGPLPSATPASTLKLLRILWGATLMSPAVLAVVLGAGRGEDVTAAAAQPAMLGPVRVAVVALLVLLVAVPVAYFTRLQVYKRGWQGLAVKPEAYFLGNLMLFAALEAVTMLTLVLGASVGDRGPCWAVALVAWGGLAVNFPNGRAMQAEEPRL